MFLLISFLTGLFFSGCALFGEASSQSGENVVAAQVEAREQAFVTSNQSLWQLTQTYEKNGEYEKALLVLEELAEMSTSKDATKEPTKKTTEQESKVISKNRINFSQIKNHFLLNNFDQGREVKREIDADYKSKRITLNELYKNLIEITKFNYDVNLLEELEFLGEVQKYFIFVMESSLGPENEQLAGHLINNYELFFSALKRSYLSSDFKKKLSISLINQLQKFDQYIMDDYNSDSQAVSKFQDYSRKQQKILRESFYQ